MSWVALVGAMISSMTLYRSISMRGADSSRLKEVKDSGKEEIS